MSKWFKEKIKILLSQVWLRIAPPFLLRRKEEEKLMPNNILPKLSQYFDKKSS